MSSYRYKAFLSYSHKDESWARWLQRALEGYRVPRRLVSGQGEYGEIPARLVPVFRDREDLSSSPDLTDSVRSELSAAESLIVICSPAAAQSPWVNEEIRHFRSLGRAERIYALIVDGDPQSRDPADQCFPPALTESRDGAGQEPLAADARKWADGRRLAKLKLVAGVLGIRLDELRRRDMQRQRRNLVFSTAAAVAILIVTSILAVTAITSRQAAEQRRANTEDLLGYMLGDLKELAPIRGLEIIDPHDRKTSELIIALGLDQLDEEEIRNRSAKWANEGQAGLERGRWQEAMDGFLRSRAAMISLYQRSPDTGRNLYDLAQAEFWVGNVHFERGELDLAEASFARYGAISRRLLNADPENAEYVMELAYTLVNLGALERARESVDSRKVIRLLQSALEYKQIALVLEPENEDYRVSLSNSLAYLADAHLETCDLGKAYDLRRRNVSISTEFHQRHAEDPALKTDLAFALRGMAKVQTWIGLVEPGLTSLRQSERLLSELSDADPENMDLRGMAMDIKQRIAGILAATGKLEESWTLYSSLVRPMDDLARDEQYGGLAQAVEYAAFGSEMADLLYRRGNAELAREVLQGAIGDLADLVRDNPGHRNARSVLAAALYRLWDHTGEGAEGPAGALIEGYLAGPGEASSCDDADIAARLAVMRGDKTLALDYTSQLLGKGYFEPEFVRFCRRHGLCEQ